MLALMVRPRYLVVWLVVAIVASVCCFAGAWQWHRLHEKHSINVELRGNSRDAPIDVQAVLPQSSAPGSADKAKAAQYRQVRATGSYDVAGEVVVRGQTVGSTDEGAGELGFLVLTPLRIDAADTVLVVRGFVKATQNATVTPSIPAPPTGQVTIVGRVKPGESKNDKFGQLPVGQVDSINSAEAQKRLGSTVLAGYLELEAGQPGGSGLIAIPAPDLSNPAGGAIEPQHLAYVIQWFVFALLALALPFILARADLRHSPAQEPENTQRTAEERDRRDAKLADRYGR